MPNWCLNKLQLKHDDPEVIKRVKTSIEQEKFFSTLVPPKVSNKADFDILEAQVDAWGTKWEPACPSILDIRKNYIEVEFDTPWNAPTTFYECLYNQGFSLVLGYYWEPGMGFGGIWKNGDEEHYDDIYLATLKDIPNDLQEAFNMREYLTIVEKEN